MQCKKNQGLGMERIFLCPMMMEKKLTIRYSMQNSIVPSDSISWVVQTRSRSRLWATELFKAIPNLVHDSMCVCMCGVAETHSAHCQCTVSSLFFNVCTF